MDGFEKHIRDNKSQFDEHKPNRKKMWNKIQAGLDPSSTLPSIIPFWKKGWFRIAASVAIVVGLGFALFTLGASRNTVYSNTTELLEIDLYYENLVAEQVQLVNSSPVLSVEEKKEFLDFMTELDHEYEALKIQFYDEGDSEKILEAIVVQYQKRIELIQSLLNRINQTKTDPDDQGIRL